MGDEKTRKPTSRLTKIVAWTAGLTTLACIHFALITGIIAGAETKKLRAAEVWCEQAEKTIAADPRFTGLMIGAPCRMYAFSPPSWGIFAQAVVLDDATEAAFRNAVLALNPPKEPRFQVLNCAGDEDLFKKLSAQSSP